MGLRKYRLLQFGIQVSLCLSLAACGGKFSRIFSSDSTTVTFTHSRDATNKLQHAAYQAQAGGVIVWGSSGTNKISFVLPNDTPAVPKSLSLANGTWAFYSIGWAGNSNSDPMKGNVRCGTTSASLTGSATAVNLTLAQDCQSGMNGFFGPAAYLGTSPLTPIPLTLLSCGSFAPKTSGFTNCDTDIGDLKSYTVSVGVVDPSIGGSSDANPTLWTSSCQIHSGTPLSQTTTSLEIPVGDGSHGPITIINGYMNSTCTGAPAQFIFQNGLAGSEVAGNGKISSSGGQTLVYLVHAAPTISGTIPATISANTAASFVVSGNNFSTGSPPTATLGSASCTVQVIDSQSFICTLPVGGLTPGSYSLIVTNPNGLNATLASVSVGSGAAPVLSSIFPGTESYSAGGPFMVTGTNFISGAIVYIGTTMCSSVTFVNSTELDCVVPSGLPTKNYAVTVVNPSGLGSVSTQLLNISGDIAPSISAISPMTVPETDTAITISGSNFVAGASVTVGGANCNITNLSSSSITCNAPSGSLAPAMYTVIVTNPDGLVDLHNLNVTADMAPSLSNISPVAGHAGSSTTIVLSGTNFSDTNGANFAITVGGQACGLASSVSSTSVSCYTSSSLTAGTYQVVLTNGDGLQTTESVQFTTTNDAIPTISQVSPSAISSVATVPAATITITGSGFLPTAQVFVNGSVCGGVAITNSGTTITCTAPTGLSTGSYPVKVLNGDGQVVQSGTIAVTTDIAPTISDTFPTAGTQFMGTHITVHGSGFAPSGALAVFIGGSPCANLNYISPTALECDTPSLSAGTYDVVVRNADSVETTQSVQFTYSTNAAPSFTAATPSTISQYATSPLTEITITGSNFLAGAQVYIGGNMCGSVNVVDANTITCTAPIGMSPGNQNINILAADNQVAFSPAGYMTVTSDVAPTVSSATPTTMASGVATSISIFGTDFVSGASVTIGSYSCNSVSVVSSTAITCTAPGSIPVSTLPIVVTNPDGLESTQTLNFNISGDPAPTIASFLPIAIPPTGTAPATTITINGSNFTSTPTVMIGSSYVCGGASVSNAGSTITCTAPGSIPVGTYSLEVINPDGETVTAGGTISVVNDSPPTVTSIFPTAGAYGVPTAIEINGSGFVSGATVQVGGVTCTSVAYVNSTQLTCMTSGSLAIGGYNVEVTNPDYLQSPQVVPFSVSGSASPNLTLVAPSTIPLGSNPQITITGTNLSAGGISVNLVSGGGNYTCSSPTVSNSGTIITCTPPGSLASNTYNVTVINSDGQAASNLHLFVDNSFGSGADGSPSMITSSIASSAMLNGRTISANRNINNISSISASATQDLVLNGPPIAAADFSVGDEVAWHVTAAATGACESSAGSLHAGKFGFAHITNIDYSGNGTITIDAPITNIPNNSGATGIAATVRTAGSSFCVIQVLRVPNFQNLSVQGGVSSDTAISPSNYDMSQGMGGIVMMRVAGTLSATTAGSGNVTFAADGAGFAGGACTGTCNGAFGDGIKGIAVGSADTGGDGGFATSGAGGGGNGGSGGAGGNGAGGGQSNSYGTCKPSAGCASLGGGGGAGYNSSSTAHGASGGGIVLVYANNVTSTSPLLRVQSYGGTTGGADTSSPGGGAGGTALIQMKTNSINNLYMSTSGTAASAGSYGGGGGGGGVTEAKYCSSTVPNFDSGSGSPAAQPGMGGTGTYAGSNGSAGIVSNMSLVSGLEYCP